MNDKPIEEIPQLKVGTGEIEIEILSEYPQVAFANQKFIPYILVKVSKTELTKKLYVSARTLSIPLYEIYKNKNSLKGIKLLVKKTDENQFAKYIINEI